MTGEPMHTASKERMTPELMLLSECAPQLSKTIALCFQPITQRYGRKTVELPLQQSSHYDSIDDPHAPAINYCLESAVAIMLCFQL